MKLKSTILTLALLAGFCSAAGADDRVTTPSLEGVWEGSTLVRTAEIEVDFVLNLVHGTTEHFQGTVSFPTQGPKEYPLSSLIFEGSDVSFVTSDDQGVTSIFQGKLQPEGSVTGTVSEQGTSYPFVMSRRSTSQSLPEAPEVRRLSEQGEELRALFNQDVDNVRLVMILAPACGTCRMGAGLVQRYVLDRIDDPRVRVYVIWEAVGKDDSAQEAARSAAFLSDPRVTHFWSPERFTGHAFQETVELEGTPAWDVFLLFPGDRRWDAGVPPQPSGFMHNLPKRLPAEKTLNGEALATQVRALLDATARVSRAAQ